MKGKKILSISISLILAMLLCAALVFVVSAEETNGDILYEVTLSDGSVKKITEEKDFNALYTSYSNVVKIKLYSDLEIQAVSGSASNYIKNNLEIDLNGKCIKTNGGYLRPEASALVLVHNGKIVHSSSYFAFINSATAKLVVRDCEITATLNFIHQRDGDVVIESSTVSSSVVSDAGFVQMSFAGKSSNLAIDGVTFADAKMCLVQIARNNLSVLKNVDIKDTAFSTTKSVITFGDDTTASNNTLSCVTSVKFSGNTKLSFASFVKKDGLLPATFSFAPGVKVSSIPSANAGSTALAKISFVDGATEFSDNTDSDKDTYPKITFKSDVFYALTKTDGSIVNVSETKSFYALISEYGAISKIKLFADLEIQAVSGSASNYINNDLEIDLNGKCIKAGGGYLRPDASAEVLVHGGKISHASSSFVFINSADAKCIIDNCTMDVTYNFVQLRAGSFTVSNSMVTSSVDSTGAFAAISYVGAVSDLLLDGVTFESAKFPIVSVGRDANTVSKNITIKDSVIGTTKQIITFNDQATAAARATVKVNIEGKTKLSYSKFVNNQAALPDVTSFTFADGVLLSTAHNITAGSILFSGGADGFLENDDEVYKIVVSNTSPRYLVKKSDGSEVKVFGVATLQELFKIADSGSVITLLGDVDLTAEISAGDITDKSVEINLNGYTFTNSGARFRAYGNSKITFYGGKIVDSAEKQFLFTGGSEEDKQLMITFRDCEILADTSFIQLRNGSLAFEDCIINTNNASILVTFSYAGVDSSLVFDGCTVNAGNAIPVSIMRNESEAERKVSIIDSTVNTNGSLIKFEDSALNENTVTEVEILGSSKIKCKSFENETNTYENTVFKFGLGVKMTTPPVISLGTIELEEGAEGFSKVDDDEYPYAVVSSVPLGVRLQFALAFYTDFSLNVCFDESEFSKIIEVKHDDKALEYTKGYGKYTYPIKGISPLTIDQKQEISITYYNYGLKTTKTVEYSVMDYVKALMESNYSDESKQLVCRSVDYAVAVFEYADVAIPAEISEFTSSEQYAKIGNSEWENSVPVSATSVGDLYKLIDSASFIIDTGIRLRFYLKDDIGSGILTVRSRTVNKVYTVENSLVDGNAYFDCDMRAFEYYNGIVNITFGDITGSYDFKTYANSEAVKENENGNVEALTVAMYNYFREANEYSLVSDKDFNPTASVVVKDGKTGTVTYIFDDGVITTGEYTAQMLRDYENLKISYGLIGENYATLETVYNAETGKYEYVLDENGKYVYTVNESAAAFWRALVAEFSDRIEYTSHTYTHDFAGFDDEGGTIQYVDTSGNIKTVTLPKGSASAELYANIQIFNDLFGEDALTVVEPGIPANRGDIIVDGVLYRGYYEYYTELLLKLYEEGLLVGARGQGVKCDEEYIITPDALADLEVRFNMHAYSLRHTQTVESWKQYVDFATESGGWALIMLHRIYADGTAGVDHVIHTKESETRELFEYTNRDDVWVTTLTEATKYYSEWATSTVSTKMGDGKIILTVTDTENNEVYDEALTVKVTVPTSWEFCIVNGEEIKVTVAEDGVRYIYVDVVPDSGDVEIIKK